MQPPGKAPVPQVQERSVLAQIAERARLGAVVPAPHWPHGVSNPRAMLPGGPGLHPPPCWVQCRGKHLLSVAGLRGIRERGIRQGFCSHSSVPKPTRDGPDRCNPPLAWAKDAKSSPSLVPWCVLPSHTTGIGPAALLVLHPLVKPSLPTATYLCPACHALDED